MVNTFQVSIDIIVHATENVSKFFDSFEEMFGIAREDFMIQNLTGHYENPITMLSLKRSKNQAKEFRNRLLKLFSENQLSEILGELDNRIDRSTLHIRLSKQELIKGRIEFKEKDSMKLKISTPIYNKNDTHKIFTDILKPSTKLNRKDQ